MDIRHMASHQYLLSSLRSPALWILILTAVVYQFVVVPYWKPNWDSAFYISFARALVQGEGYTYMGYSHIKYPPGFPFLLAPIELFFGHQFLLMRLLITVCAVGSVGMSYLLIRRIESISVACAVSIMTAASYALIYEATHVLSDVPYMLVSLAALVAAERYCRHLSRRNAILTLGLILAAYSIRIIGFTLALAVATAILLDVRGRPVSRRMRHVVLVVGVMALTMGIWMGRNALVTRGFPSELREAISYERELMVLKPSDLHSRTLGWSDYRSRIRANLDYYEQLLVNLLTARQVQNTPLVHWFSTLWLLGWGIALIRRRSVMETYTFFYIWVYLLWSSWQGERFLVPILPMIFYYALQPLLLLFRLSLYVKKEIIERPRFQSPRATETQGYQLLGWIEPISRVAALSLLTLAVVQLNGPLVISSIRAERQDPYYRGAVAEFIQTIEWVRDNTPEDAVIITNRAPWAYLLSGRKSFTSSFKQQEALDSFARNGGTHVIANTWSRSYLKPLIQANPERFRKIHRIGSNIIYEIQ